MNIDELANEFHKLNPEQACELFNKISYQCINDADELPASWQDANAGKVWAIMADGLLKTSTKIQRYWNTI